MTSSSTSERPRAERPYWREDLAPYAQPHLGRSLRELATSVVPYLGLSVAMYYSLRVSYLLTLAIAIPAAGFLVRTFILFHDCTHGAFVPTRRANSPQARRARLPAQADPRDHLPKRAPRAATRAG